MSFRKSTTTITLAYFFNPKIKIQLMKKGLLLFVCAISLATLTQAQVRFGFKAGVNLANVTGDIDGNSMKIGFNAGAVAKISVSESFSVQPELVFSSQGTKYDFEDTEVKMNLNYLNLPIMAQYNTSGFVLEAGPQIGFLMSAKAKAGDMSGDIKDGLKSIDFGLAFGAGYQTQSGFGVNARFNLGLANIVDGEEDEEGELKNSVIQVGVFYLLGGGGSAKK
jgi:hypothetical protein